MVELLVARKGDGFGLWTVLCLCCDLIKAKVWGSQFAAFAENIFSAYIGGTPFLTLIVETKF